MYSIQAYCVIRAFIPIFVFATLFSNILVQIRGGNAQMHIDLINSRFMRTINLKFFTVLLLWLFGLFSGIMSSLSFPVNYFFKPLSVSPLIALIVAFMVHTMPVIAAIASVHFNKALACYALCFVKAYCCGYTGMLLFFQWGSGAWLLRFPFMFSGYCSSVITLWVLLKTFGAKMPSDAKKTYVLVASVFCCCLMDTFIISPFLFCS